MTLENTVSKHRSSLLQKNIMVSFLAKGWSAIIVLLMVPITLNCLGYYNNGVWLTISSVMLWIDNLDIGLGNGMRNKLAVYLAHGEEARARSLVSSTFAMLTYIIIPTLLVLLVLIMTCDNYQLLNVEPDKVADLDQILMVTVTLVCTTFIFKLIGTYIVYKSVSHSLLHIALVNTACPLLVYLIAFPFTFWYKFPHLRPSFSLVDMKEAKEVISMGILFFIIQICGVVLLMTSNILISKLFSPAMVTPYQIAYRYLSIMLVAFTVICMPFWNATTDAYARGDLQWIRQATRKLRLMTIGIMIGLTVMVLASDWVYTIWIGNDHNVDFRMSIAVAVYIFILIYSMRYSYFINGIGKLRLQLIFSTIAAILFIPLAYLVVRLTDDIIWFIGVMCLVNIPGLIVNRLQFNKLTNGQAKGIWNQ